LKLGGSGSVKVRVGSMAFLGQVVARPPKRNYVLGQVYAIRQGRKGNARQAQSARIVSRAIW
jgi:hypothetical protein